MGWHALPTTEERGKLSLQCVEYKVQALSNGSVGRGSAGAARRNQERGEESSDEEIEAVAAGGAPGIVGT